MALEPEQSTPNVLKERDPALFTEVEDFRATLEEILLDKLDNVLNNPAFRHHGQFLPRDDLKAIAQVMSVLTRDSWGEEHLDQFDASWREAMRSDFFAAAFETKRFRIENAVNTARNDLSQKREVNSVTQGTLW
jgi:hypothetical protein